MSTRMRLQRAAVVALAVVMLGLAVCLGWWHGPVVRALVPMARPGWHRLSADARTTAEAQFRLAAIQATAALGAAVALVYTARNFRLTRRGQVTDRFTKALERLGSPEMYVRLGGILALEQIVQDSPDQATHATQVLNAFLTDRAPIRQARQGQARPGRVAAGRRAARQHNGTTAPAAMPEELPGLPHPDIQAALTALTRPVSRRHVDPLEHIDLEGKHLTGADLTKKNLIGARLARTNLTGARLSGANVARARLFSADLTGAKLTRANLTRANLTKANISRADLTGANLTKANLTRADLTEADLTGAGSTVIDLKTPELFKTVVTRTDLTEADLTEADLTGANLTGAKLTGARLFGADLTGAELTVDQLLSTHFDGSVKGLSPRLRDDPRVAERLASGDWP
ncbi:pentapeptide repeat-containing protein [Streptomyces sioyaensis]|uniref:pentapeptide repeat-containing protein n=1 Tax=Streptomyces sioyaensis TaxID=67364 RepID=UPI0037CF3F83